MRTKIRGGVGIRKIRDINHASGIRLVWRLCTSNSMWAKWMIAHYMKGEHLHQSTASILDSGTWKWICALKSQALLEMTRVMGNGEKTSLLYDTWIPRSKLISLLSDTLLPPEIRLWKVSDIIENGYRFLKDQSLLPVWSLISQQCVPSSDEPDNWKWNCTSSGLFSFKSAWELIRTKDPTFQFTSLIWFPTHSPKMAICLLRALQSKLLTRDFLKTTGVIDMDTRVLCNVAQESINHLFLECPYSTYLWSLCRLKLGLLGLPTRLVRLRT